MKMPARSVAWLLPLLLVSCTHNTTQVQPLAPPIVDTPPPQPSTAPKDLPPPVVSVPAQPTPPNSTTTTQSQQPPAQPAPKHKKPAPAPQPTQQASNGSAGVSAIGQLSSGAPSDLRQQTSELIVSTERGLNGINRSLSEPEQKTATQIREFLKQAREALATSDVDGAHTLAKKAQVLLTELTQ